MTLLFLIERRISMKSTDKIYIAGSSGMVGSALVRELHRQGYQNLITKTHQELDLTVQKEVDQFFQKEHPEYVIDAAALVGGIEANRKAPADFLMKNLQIQCHLLESAFLYGVKRFLFLASSCIYPKEASQPMSEEMVLTGFLEPTNEGYAIAKIAGLKQCQFYKRQYGREFFSVVPCNLYGYYDNFSPECSNFVPAMIRKFHEAKRKKLDYVELWGTGKAYREILFADDMAEACVFLMNQEIKEDFYNLGYGTDFTVYEIAKIIQKIVGFEGNLVCNPKYPEGMARKLVDSSKLNRLGWKPKHTLEEGLKLTYQWYQEQYGGKE